MPYVKKYTLTPDAGDMHIGSDAVTPGFTVIENSGVIQIGDPVEWNGSGFVQRIASATGGVLGIVLGVAQDQIQRVVPDAGTTDTWTVEADNQTDKKLYAIIDISPFSVYSIGADATLGTTTGSDLSGKYFDNPSAASHSQLDESTQSDTTGIWHSWGVDPEDSTKLLVNINETAIIANVT